MPASSPKLKGKAGRYARVTAQLEDLLAKPGDELSRMATLVAVVHHKMPHFFWTGFYLLREPTRVDDLPLPAETAGADPGAKTEGARVRRAGADLGAQKNDLPARRAGVDERAEDDGEGVQQEMELIVGPYQGPVACQRLEPHQGVCWAGVDRQMTVLVVDISKFPGHIACDSRSRSEIVVPLKDRKGRVVGVLDVDSEQLAAFDEVDAEWLERLVGLIYRDV